MQDNIKNSALKSAKNGDIIVLYMPSKVIGGFVAHDYFLEIFADVEFRNAKNFVVSLRHLQDFDPYALFAALKFLVGFAKSVKKQFGICEYSPKIFGFMQKNLHHIGATLFFENLDVAAIFLSDTKDYKKVLLYSPDQAQSEFIINNLCTKGHVGYRASDNVSFESMKGEFDCAVSELSVPYIECENRKTFIDNGIVFYKLEGIIDSDFSQEFDMKYHNALLQTGFKFFVFMVNGASGMNINGANFLTKLAVQAIQYRAFISVCGVSQGSLSAVFDANLKDAGVLTYASVKEFYDDNTTIYVDENVKIAPTRISKQTAALLNLIGDSVDRLLGDIFTSHIQRQKPIIGALRAEQSDVFGSVVFYGDVNFRLALGFDEKIFEILAMKILGSNCSNPDHALEFVISALCARLCTMLNDKGLSVTYVNAKIFHHESYYDQESLGAYFGYKMGENSGFLFVL